MDVRQHHHLHLPHLRIISVQNHNSQSSALYLQMLHRRQAPTQLLPPQRPFEVCRGGCSMAGPEGTHKVLYRSNHPLHGCWQANMPC